MRDKVTGLRIRFLKEFAFEGIIPPAGLNRHRINVWKQGTLALGDDEPSQTLKNTELIIVWTEIHDIFQCDAYQPLTTGKFPKGATGKIVMRMPLGIGDDYQHIKFSETEQDEAFLPEHNRIITEQVQQETVEQS